MVFSSMPTRLSMPVPCWTRTVMPSGKDVVVTWPHGHIFFSGRCSVTSKTGGEGCRIPCASRLLPGCLDKILKDTMDKTAGMYVTDVRWWLTFQKAVSGE